MQGYTTPCMPFGCLSSGRFLSKKACVRFSGKNRLLSSASPKKTGRKKQNEALPAPACSHKDHGVYPERAFWSRLGQGGQGTILPEGQYVSTTRIRSLKMKSSFLAPNAEMAFVYGVHLFWILSMRDEKILHVCKNTRGKMGD